VQFMTSYAQNHEDVLLERCFRDQAEGFYIDVGAWDPVIDSVTHWFYLRGWRGINVEPTLQYFEQLQEQRSRDINLRCAVSDNTGTAILRLVRESGLSTICELDSQFSEDLEEGGFSTEEIEVPATTLANICAEYVSDGIEIDFLKIDVEGAEAAVVAGADWQRYRPRVLVVEAIAPLVLGEGTDRPRPEITSHQWEECVHDAGYLSAFADGVNRFYVREEEAHLLDHFQTPVNVLDLYVPYSERRTQAEVATLQEQLAERQHRVTTLSDELAAAQGAVTGLSGRVEELDDRIADLVTSTSWRVTAPLRAVTKRLRRS
jgi:FkbM family methyltransferase